jgi:oxygen-independent coproporphyrinogen-3 oxidase
MPPPMSITNPPPLALYVHLPWCVHKCPYCDFNSFELRGALADADYIDAVLRDLDFELPLVAGRVVLGIFIGGGTPSLFSGPAITRLLDGIRARLRLQVDCEITLEANPGTAEAQRFAAYRAAGVNRLSVGAQSFRSRQLEALGRVHGVSEIGHAVALAREAGFDNVNLDLMYGLPQDDLTGAIADLEQAIALGPEHLSCTSSRSSRTRRFIGARPRCRTTSSSPPSKKPAASCSRAMVTRVMKSRPMRNPAGAAGTISITGSSATTSASVQARTASSRDRTARSSAARACAIRGATGPAPVRPNA